MYGSREGVLLEWFVRAGRRVGGRAHIPIISRVSMPEPHCSCLIGEIQRILYGAGFSAGLDGYSVRTEPVGEEA